MCAEHLTCHEVEGDVRVGGREVIIKKKFNARLPLIFGVACHCMEKLTVCGSSVAVVLIKSKLITTSSSTS